jgi:hypothetical protein
MNAISDRQIADLYDGRWKPAAGVYTAPAAVARWDGAALTLELTGAALDAETAAHSPRLARIVALISKPHAAVAHPTIAALEADYSAATAPLAAVWPVLPLEAFAARLAVCRACEMWDEPAREGRGLCNSVRCQCAQVALWHASKRCAEDRWPSNGPLKSFKSASAGAGELRG